MTDEKIHSNEVSSEGNLLTVSRSILELQRYPLAYGDYFWKAPSGKKIKLKKVGDLIAPDWFERYQKKVSNLEVKLVSRVDNVSDVEVYFDSLDHAQLERNRHFYRNKILIWLRDKCVANEECSSLEPMLAILRFIQSNRGIPERLFSTHPDFVNQNFLKGTILAYLALIMGYQNTTFLLDVFLLPSFIGINLLDSKTPEQFSDLLKKGALQTTGDLLENLDFINKELNEFLKYKYSYHLLELTLEDMRNFTGPRNLKPNEVTLFESVFISVMRLENFELSFEKGSFLKTISLLDEVPFGEKNLSSYFIEELSRVVIEKDQDKGAA